MRSRSGEAGSTVVEFSLTLLLLLTFFFGIMEFGRMLYAYDSVCDLARLGTRYAIVRGSACTSWETECPASAADIQAYVKSLPVALDPSAINVTVDWCSDLNWGATCPNGNNNPGSVVKVSVTYNFTSVLPFLLPGALHLKSSSQMVISQ